MNRRARVRSGAVVLLVHFFLLSMTKAAAQLIKNSMDKKFGASWHCAIGEGFGFEITYQQRNMIYVFYGQIGVLTFK